MKTKTPPQIPADYQRDTVGRTYSTEQWEVHSRRMSNNPENPTGKGKWYGANKFPTLSEAQAHLAKIIKPSRVEMVGGIAVSFGVLNERYEYRIVRVVRQCEVIEVTDGIL